eukprot:jgi/Mesvir1/4140/Mv13052-RA.1
MFKPIGGPVRDVKTPENPKYKGVAPRVDSGFNAIKLAKYVDESRLNMRFRTEEHFRRLRCKDFAKLYQEEALEMLLLDVREAEEMEVCRVRGAVSYPSAMIRRSVNYFTREILEFKNKEPERIIVLYDEDEKVAVPTANAFFEKGVDNVFIIQGGLREMSTVADYLLEGSLPPRPSTSASTSTQRGTKGRPGSATPSRPGTGASVRSDASAARAVTPNWPPTGGSQASGIQRPGSSSSFADYAAAGGGSHRAPATPAGPSRPGTASSAASARRSGTPATPQNTMGGAWR